MPYKKILPLSGEFTYYVKRVGSGLRDQSGSKQAGSGSTTRLNWRMSILNQDNLLKIHLPWSILRMVLVGFLTNTHSISGVFSSNIPELGGFCTVSFGSRGKTKWFFSKRRVTSEWACIHLGLTITSTTENYRVRHNTPSHCTSRRQILDLGWIFTRTKTEVWELRPSEQFVLKKT